ncbi:MAG TPA: hypothetical protein VFR23_14510 [Jiangellaceae bacterium]|nr:hypothetical protein [Jiangellaceae bacterium]
MTIGWDDDFVVLPDTEEDDVGWGDEPSDENDRRLLEERPPHW